MDISQLRAALKAKPCTKSEIREMFKELNEEAWEVLEQEFAEPRAEIINIFCRSVGSDQGE